MSAEKNKPHSDPKLERARRLLNYIPPLIREYSPPDAELPETEPFLDTDDCSVPFLPIENKIIKIGKTIPKPPIDFLKN